MTTDTTEKGLETLIMQHMTGTDGLAAVPNRVAERPDDEEANQEMLQDEGAADI